MTKISVTGANQHLRTTINTLYDLGLLHLEDYEGDLETGQPLDEAEKLSKKIVKIRSILSKLPESEKNTGKNLDFEDVTRNLSEIKDKSDRINQDIEKISNSKKTLKNKQKRLESLKGLNLSEIRTEETDRLETFIGKIDVKQFKEQISTDKIEIHKGAKAYAIIYDKKEEKEIQEGLRTSKKEEYDLTELSKNKSVEELLKENRKELDEIDKRIKNKKDSLTEISNKWRTTLEESEKLYKEKVEKAEAPLKFASSDKAFFVKGWIPTEKYELLEETLAEKTNGRIHVQKEEGKNPPVQHKNNKIVEDFESLTDLVSVPKYNELDPSFMIFLTFPLMFGFMIGDAGYGLTSLLVFYGGMKMYPQAASIFKSLMWCSVATLIFGLIFGDAFGYIIFGEGNAITAATGITLFESIPLIYHRVDYLGEVFLMSAIIGAVHVNLGILLGAYNEYVHHGLLEAIFAKGSWFLLQGAAVTLYFTSSMYSSTTNLAIAAVMFAPILAMLYKGEGVEGIVEIPSILSNILSYLRLFGVSVAAISLASVVNAIASPMFATGTAWGLVAGTLILITGHTFNTFIKIMEGFLQGIRLHYVELFNWFYEGGGKKYNPFGN